MQLDVSPIRDDPQKIWLLVGAFYLIAVPVCSGIPLLLPPVVWGILWLGYPLWFVVWLAALFWTLSKLGKLYRQTAMEMWGWFSVPYSVALPALPLALGLKGYALWHLLGFFFVLACLAVPSSVLWALTTIFQMFRNRNATSSKVMLGIIPLGVLLWIIIFNKNEVGRLW